MRADMAKVIVERPRIGSRDQGKPKGYRRRFQKLADEPIGREGMRRRWIGQGKWLNEHLGPLRRYIDSQVGRPWNKVFSEICAHINRDSAVQDHVRDHVAEYVVVNVIEVDGVPCSGDGDYGRPLHSYSWRRWYVCPRTGILRRIVAPRSSNKPARAETTTPRYIHVSPSLQCRKIGGAWHLVMLEPLPILKAHGDERDVVLNLSVSQLPLALARTTYGANVYAAHARRLSKRELRQFPIPCDLWA